MHIHRESKKKDVAAKRIFGVKIKYNQSLTVSVGVSKLDYTGLIFINLVINPV